jgi:Ran GTPase-activating protein (RanGAP) involved in mRNA processing and transport
VQYLYISTNEIDVDGARSLADGLKENSTLRELRLSSNIFSADGTIAIFAALKVNKTLNTLGMDESGKLNAIALIGDALQQNHGLASLSLSRNQIDEEGGRALLAALKRNDTLKTINLAGNDLSDGLRKQSIRSWSVATSQTFSLDSLLGRHPRTFSS